jgi:hypothetical protein
MAEDRRFRRSGAPTAGGDRGDSNFSLHEFPGWEQATEAQIKILELEAVRPFLQPIRDRWGRIDPSSWLRWRSGERRTGSHADPGTVDFVPALATIPEVFQWIRAMGLPYGKLIDERDHIHRTRPGVQGATQEAYVEYAEGSYASTDPEAGFPGGAGAWGQPIELPGLSVSVAGRRTGWVAWLAVAALLLALGRRG